MNATVLKIAALAFFLPACGCAGRAFFLSQQLLIAAKLRTH